MADIKELQLPLADVLIETGRGIVAMNDALGTNNVGATTADVAIKFMASLSQGYDYTKHTVKAGAAFTFWIFGGAGAGTYRSTNLHLYRRYSEHIYITVNIHFEVLPSVTTP